MKDLNVVIPPYPKEDSTDEAKRASLKKERIK